jgi:NAD(P)-dependent dehydrogenase (short-subunit alcohol dehydrogenase family)
MRSVREFAAEFIAGHPRLDVLVNNAGAVNMGRSVTADGFETTFGVNHLGYFLVTDLLLETLKASAPARIVNVSSDAHVGARMNFDDLQSERYSGMRAYGQSKLANVLFTYELARRLEGTGVTVNALHPGVVMTGFGRNNAGPFGFLFAAFHTLGRPFLLTAAQGAETSVHLASSPEVEGVTGRYFVRKRATASSPASRDDEAALRLWQISEELTKAGAPAAAAAV